MPTYTDGGRAKFVLPPHLDAHTAKTKLREFRLAMKKAGNGDLSLRVRQLSFSKRERKLKSGPYVGFTVAKGIRACLTDAVILTGSKWLLDRQVFSCSVYHISRGIGDINATISAESGTKSVRGTWFNADSAQRFGAKCTVAKGELNSIPEADLKLMIANSGAVNVAHVPLLNADEFLLLVDILNGKGTLFGQHGQFTSTASLPA